MLSLSTLAIVKSMENGTRMSGNSIDKVKVQIPGTMYYLELAEDKGRWVLSLLLRNDVERKTVVPVLSKNGINKAAREVLNDSRLEVEKYPLGKVCDQLFEAAGASLPVISAAVEAELPTNEEMDELKQKIDLIETNLENTMEELKENIVSVTESLSALETERVARLETELQKRAEDKSEEEMLDRLQERINQLEESIASSQGDERVPSILTAIEAIESKIGQLEGNVATQQPSESETSTMRMELARVAKTFDVINERLTKLENRLNALSSTSTDSPIEQ